MGVDAKIYATLPADVELTAKQLRRLSAGLADCIGPESFYMDRDKDMHVLSFGDKFDRSEFPAVSGQVIRVNQAWRYYGSNYTRGPFLQIYGTLRWLMEQIPGCTVWYYGDCDEEPRMVTRESLEDMLLAFLQIGRRPYIHRHSESGFFCGFCDVELSNVGGGWGDGNRKYSILYCTGCGGEWKTDGERYAMWGKRGMSCNENMSEAVPSDLRISPPPNSASQDAQ